MTVNEIIIGILFLFVNSGYSCGQKVSSHISVPFSYFKSGGIVLFYGIRATE